MRRFFIDPDQIKPPEARLTGNEAHHLTTVLRLPVGEIITLFDGTGTSYQARITGISSREVAATILSTENYTPPGVTLHLGQGLLKGKKMDFLVQKATELGLAAIYPFTSDNCAVRPDNAARAERWSRIILEACKQCGRPMPLTCHAVSPLDLLLTTTRDFDRKLLFWEKETDAGLKSATGDIRPGQSVFFLIGPEGGFSAAEVTRARQEGFQTVTLGGPTLRAETATLAATAILQYLAGNLA